LIEASHQKGLAIVPLSIFFSSQSTETGISARQGQKRIRKKRKLKKKRFAKRISFKR
jgi:tmRNA-binding protein